MVKAMITVVIVLLIDLLIISAVHKADERRACKRVCNKHECPFENDYCCWSCFMGSECQSACKLNPNECEKGEKE